MKNYKKRNRIRLVLAFVLLAGLMIGCISTNKLTTRNYSYLYKRIDDPFKFKGRVFHQSDSNSLFIFRIYLPGLKYESEEKESKYTARYSLFYEAYSSFEKNVLVDSATINYEDSVHFNREKYLTHQVAIPVKTGTTGHMAVKFEDKNAETSLKRYYRIDKSVRPGQQYFLLKKGNNQVHFFDFSRYYDEYQVRFGDTNNPINADIYKEKRFALADPPFVPNLQESDQVKKIKTVYLPDNKVKVRKEPRIYHINTLSRKPQSFLFYAADDDFPQVRTPDSQIPPLRYITTNKEFLNIKNASNRELALENFWYNVAGDIERALNKKEMYNERVEMANKLFTSYKAGWKTDRGMIYIVMGTPDRVHFFKDSEEWVYGNPPNIEAIRFRFVREKKPFAYKNFVLERKEEYRLPWYKAVENWKK